MFNKRALFCVYSALKVVSWHSLKQTVHRRIQNRYFSRPVRLVQCKLFSLGDISCRHFWRVFDFGVNSPVKITFSWCLSCSTNFHWCLCCCENKSTSPPLWSCNSDGGTVEWGDDQNCFIFQTKLCFMLEAVFDKKKANDHFLKTHWSLKIMCLKEYFYIWGNNCLGNWC